MFYVGTGLNIGCVVVFLILGSIPEIDRNWVALPLAMLFVGFGLQMTGLMRHKQELDDLDEKFKQLFSKRRAECIRREKKG